MRRLTQAQKTRLAQLKRQRDRINVEVAKLETDDETEMESEEDDASAKTEEEDVAAKDDDAYAEEDDEAEASEDDDADMEDDEEEVEARVQLFQNLPEAKGQQRLAASLARNGTKFTDAKALLADAQAGDRLAARKDHRVPRGGGERASDKGASVARRDAAVKALNEKRRKRRNRR